MHKPNTILNRFDCLRSDVKHESWEQLVEDFKDRCVTTQISTRLTYNTIQYITIQYFIQEKENKK